MESEPTEAELAAFMADEEVALELLSLQDILGSPPARANPHTNDHLRVRVAVRAQVHLANPEVAQQNVRVEAVKSTPEAKPPEATPPGPRWLTEMFNELDDHEGNTGA